ncbi:MAG TPA: hypothetical protein DER60_08505, partial [Syntrophomonas sp.]|nr:hypothetical protein [Syntrophomonas sp.]
MFKTRVITALTGVTIILFCLYQGGMFWKGLFFVMAVVSLYEYLDMMKHKNIPVLWLPGYGL